MTKSPMKLLSKEQRLAHIKNSFRPVVGEEKHAGKWRASFYAPVCNEEVITTETIRALLRAAGVQPDSNDVLVQPSEYADLSRGNREDIFLTNDAYDKLAAYIDTECKKGRKLSP
jgi:hypothetical protein